MSQIRDNTKTCIRCCGSPQKFGGGDIGACILDCGPTLSCLSHGWMFEGMVENLHTTSLVSWFYGYENLIPSLSKVNHECMESRNCVLLDGNVPDITSYLKAQFRTSIQHYSFPNIMGMLILHPAYQNSIMSVYSVYF